MYLKIREGMSTIILDKVESYNDFMKLLSGCTTDEVKRKALVKFGSEDYEQFNIYMYRLEDDLLVHKITVVV